jgi:hypothetical protein
LGTAAGLKFSPAAKIYPLRLQHRVQNRRTEQNSTLKRELFSARAQL